MSSIRKDLIKNKNNSKNCNSVLLSDTIGKQQEAFRGKTYVAGVWVNRKFWIKNS